jgi:hypothetical protein
MIDILIHCQDQIKVRSNNGRPFVDCLDFESKPIQKCGYFALTTARDQNAPPNLHASVRQRVFE